MTDTKKTPSVEETALAQLIDEISEGGEHDFAEVVETIGASLLTAKRLATIVFGSDAPSLVLEIYDRLLELTGGDDDSVSARD